MLRGVTVSALIISVLTLPFWVVPDLPPLLDYLWRYISVLSTVVAAAGLFYAFATRHGNFPPLLARLWSASYKVPIPDALRADIIRQYNSSWIVGALAVIYDSDTGRYLLAKHAYPYNRKHAFWALPGGTVRETENIPQTLSRHLCRELGVKAVVGKLLGIDTSTPPFLDLFFECQLTNTNLRPSAAISHIDRFGPDDLPDDTDQVHSYIIQRLSCDRMNPRSPIVNPTQVIDDSDQPDYNGRISTLERDSRFKYVPFSEQPDGVKQHFIKLVVPITVDSSSDALIAPCCRSLAHKKISDHEFGWGESHRLRCVVPNTPVYECRCGFFIQDKIAWTIRERARYIRRVFELMRPEDMQALARFLAPEDIEKITDYAAAVRIERDVRRERLDHVSSNDREASA